MLQNLTQSSRPPSMDGWTPVARAARLCGLSRHVFRRACAAGQIPLTPQQFGAYHYVSTAELEAWRTRTAPAVTNLF